MNDILKNIEEIRKEKHIKQTVIAELLGIKQPAYSNFINRKSHAINASKKIRLFRI